MRTKLNQLWDRLRSSFWFVPSLSTLVAIGLARTTLSLDSSGRGFLKKLEGWLYTGGPEGAQTLLSTIAGSLITVAGVAFSVTIVVLSLTSTQFGPRLLRNFMRDLGNQTVLGAFIATFLYCILVLRTIRIGEENGFVPHFSITVAVILAVINLFLLIYFIHHISAAIQATSVITAVARDLDEVIDHLFPEELGESAFEQKRAERGVAVPDSEREFTPVHSEETGYLQAIENDTLLTLASKNDILIRLECRPGDFINQGDTLGKGWPKIQIDSAVKKQINRTFILGKDRTFTQDIAFGIDQLAEIAVRALSPSTNDPFTAMIAIDYLGAALRRLAKRVIPSPYRFDPDHHLRVIAKTVTFPEILERAFVPIHHYGKTAPIVTLSLLKVLSTIAAHVVREEDRSAILRLANRIKQESRKLPESEDREAVEKQYRLFLSAFHEPEDRWGATRVEGKR